jgi:hypothetical protein
MSPNIIKLNESLKMQLTNLSDEDWLKMLQIGGEIRFNFETGHSAIIPGQRAKSYPNPHVVVDTEKNIVESVAVSMVLQEAERDELAGAHVEALNAVFICKLAECILDIKDVARAIPRIITSLNTPPKYVFAMPTDVAKEYLRRVIMGKG